MRKKATIIAVTSGKGGVGKTNISVNLAVALSNLPRRVCLFDADTNQANANILLGLHPELTLEHVFNGQHQVENILLKAPGGFSVIPAASGIVDGETLDEVRRKRLSDALATLEYTHDYLLIDTAAGVGRDVLFFLKAAAMIVVVITPEPTSLTNSFALLRVMLRSEIKVPVRVVVNQAANIQEFRALFRRFQAAVEKYLHLKVEALGYVLNDATVASAVRLQRPVIYLRHDAPASLCFYEIAKQLDRLVQSQTGIHDAGGLSKAVNGAISTKNTPHALQPSNAQIDLTKLDAAQVASLLTHAAKALETTAKSEQKNIASALEELIDVFITRFEDLPFQLNRTLYQYLELNDYPKETLRNLVQTLETLYVRREQRPLHDIESNIALIMSESHGDKQRMSLLVQQVINAFSRQFDHSPLLSMAQIKAAIIQAQGDKGALEELKTVIETLMASTPESSQREGHEKASTMGPVEAPGTTSEHHATRTL